jgi:hypothetical protein
MKISSGFSSSYGSTNNSPQLSPSPHNPSNPVGARKIPFGSQTQQIPDSQNNENMTGDRGYMPNNSQKIFAERLSNKSETNVGKRNTLASKFQEIERLSRPYFQPHLIDNVLSSLSLLIMTNNRWESVIDEILEKLRNSTTTLNEVFPQFLDLMPTNPTKTTKEIPLHNHHVERLPETAVSKLTEIELLLKPYHHPAGLWEVIEDLIKKFTKTNDYSILDAALVNYRRKFQGYG